MARTSYQVVILTPVWRRPGLTALHYRAVDRMLAGWATFGVCALHVVIGSEGSRSRQPAEAHGAHYVEAVNLPLGAKRNMGYRYVQRLAPEYVLALDSDDLVSPALAGAYLVAMNAGEDYVGLRDFYLYDAELRKLWHWPGYREAGILAKANRPIGTGRLIRATVLDRLDWQPHQPWVRPRSDAQMDQAMDGLKVFPRLLEAGAFPLLAVKRGGASMWHLKDLPGLQPVEENQALLKQFPEEPWIRELAS